VAITGAAPRPEEIRDFIEVKPKLNFNALEPGLQANDALRAHARALGLTPEHGVRVRLTGPVPLSDEEFATLTDRAGLMVAAMIVGVLATLWFALRSFRIIAAILVTLLVGLAVTMGAGLHAVGVFNIISIAFIALFVGLGVDFGIQFSVRYRSERHRNDDLAGALAATGRGVGIPLALASAATAAGFFSFLPTTYTGVAELGKVAGIGMMILNGIGMISFIYALQNTTIANVTVIYATLPFITAILAWLWFRERAERNAEFRSLHHHVFDTRLAVDAVFHAGFEPVAAEGLEPYHTVVLARKPLDGIAARPFQEDALREALRTSPFQSDRQAS